ncbi:MAG: Crp/Fnr family transcriptional regulator [Bacteroidia bacterium]|nr:Crp/Fnr family transcriptional regulator [Bacteroidia bacterium]
MLIDFEKLKKLYKLSRNLSFQDITTLLKAAKPVSFDQGEYIFKEGSQDRTVYFIQKGLIRTFLAKQQGEDITTWLRWEDQVFANIDELLFEHPSRFYAQAVEPTQTLSISFDVAQEIAAQNPKLEENRKYMLREIMKTNFKHSESFMLYSAEERYLNYIEQFPHIVNRVPDKYIAGILGITPVSLSRIRKRIIQREMGKND